MAAPRFDADADAYGRTANLPGTNATLAAWIYISTDRNTWSCPFALDDNDPGSTGSYYYLETDTDGTSMRVWFDSASTEGNFSAVIVNMSVGTWYFAALTRNGNNLLGYMRTLAGALTSQSLTITGTFNAHTNFRIGRSPFTDEFWNGRIAAVKMWDATLTADELRVESMQYMPKRLANLNGFWPLIHSGFDEKDFGPNARDLTVGTATFEDGPPIPWRVVRSRRPYRISGGAFNLNAESGSYTLTGVLATIAAGRLFNAEAGAYAVTGLLADLIKGFVISADAGAYSVSGIAATLLADRLLSADLGEYVVTGNAATLLADRLLTADPGTYVIIGADATLVFTPAPGAFELSADPGVYVISGSSAELILVQVQAQVRGRLYRRLADRVFILGRS